MWDEDAGDEEQRNITCPICDKSLEAEACEHVLLVVDRTFEACEGGFALDIWDAWYGRVQAAFAAAIQGERPQTWADDLVEIAWETMLEYGYEDPESPTLPFAEFADLIEDILIDADGRPHVGSPMAEFGGRFESDMLLMFAEKPADVCERADKRLTERLQPKRPSRGRKKA